LVDVHENRQCLHKLKVSIFTYFTLQATTLREARAQMR
jgi:hypothetical protein